MKIVALKSERAPEIHQLGREDNPFRPTCQDLVENLEGLEEDGCNFCFGVEEGGRLIGYPLAWVDNSRMEGRAEDVVLVDEVMLKAGARRYLYPLLRAALKAMTQAGFRGLPVEGTLQPSAEETFTTHPEIMESLGYRLAGTHQYRDEALQEELTWVRFEPSEGLCQPCSEDEDDIPAVLEEPPPPDH